jgi:hypothetical protein
MGTPAFIYIYSLHDIQATDQYLEEILVQPAYFLNNSSCQEEKTILETTTSLSKKICMYEADAIVEDSFRALSLNNLYIRLRPKFDYVHYFLIYIDLKY